METTGWAKKTGLFFRLNNFATVSGSNACDMSKFSKFYLEKNSSAVSYDECGTAPGGHHLWAVSQLWSLLYRVGQKKPDCF